MAHLSSYQPVRFFFADEERGIIDSCEMSKDDLLRIIEFMRLENKHANDQAKHDRDFLLGLIRA